MDHEAIRLRSLRGSSSAKQYLQSMFVSPCRRMTSLSAAAPPDGPRDGGCRFFSALAREPASERGDSATCLTADEKGMVTRIHFMRRPMRRSESVTVGAEVSFPLAGRVPPRFPCFLPEEFQHSANERGGLRIPSDRAARIK